MASSSSSSLGMNQLLTNPIAEKLTKLNHYIWKAQILPALRGAQLSDFLDATITALEKDLVSTSKDGKEEKITNPVYTRWVALDQQVLSFLIGSLSREMMVHVTTAKTVAEAWQAIEDIFGTTMRARSVNTRIALATTRKGDMNVSEYYNKMKSLGDEMAVAGKHLSDEEMVSYILTRVIVEIAATPMVVATAVTMIVETMILIAAPS